MTSPDFYTEKEQQLLSRIDGLCRNNTILAFSGGVDSALLLLLMKEASDKNGTRVLPVTFKTFLHPAADMTTAKRICRELDASHRVLAVDEMDNPAIADNPKDRCYLCKKMLFQKLLDLAEELEVPSVADGTNADDLTVFRPGLRALAELGIKSPLAEAGFTKAEVRPLAGKRELSVSGRPSAPCLATRFPYDTHLTKEGLRTVEEGEALLGKYISGNIRLRVHNNTARIEADPDQFPTLIKHHEDITGALRKLGFRYVTLDLAGFRSGSYDT